ncbi:MAG: ATP-binding protein [Planctomycetes bacterium]|nr:ATP-binding protein [Planctomycetota bacterium]
MTASSTASSRTSGSPARRRKHLASLEDAFFARYPESRDRECCFFFDEFQEVAGWEKFVRLLGEEIASSLRGRALSTELLPFSFAEALTHQGVELPRPWPVAGAVRSRLQKAFDLYLSIGGFPEVLDFTIDAWRRTLQSYLEIAVLRDVAERHATGNVAALRFVVHSLLRSIGGKTSANALHQACCRCTRPRSVAAR